MRSFLPQPSLQAKELLRSSFELEIKAPALPALSKRGVEDSSWGPLGYLITDPLVTDIFVNGESGVFVDRGSGAKPETRLSFSADQIRELALRLISLGNRHIDEANPCVDVRLHGGVRVHAVLPPVAPRGPLLSVRLPSFKGLGLAELKSAGMFSDAILAVLLEQISSRKNLLITGPGGSGKTTLLGALLGEVIPEERLILIEDVSELQVNHPHAVNLEARQPNLEGVGEVSLADLVKNALRMRPDRLILGECRGGEVRELLAALNTGHDGGAGTLHANSLADVPARLEALGALAGLNASALARQAVSALNTVVHLERRGGVRQIAAIGSLYLDKNRLQIRSRGSL